MRKGLRVPDALPAGSKTIPVHPVCEGLRVPDALPTGSKTIPVHPVRKGLRVADAMPQVLRLPDTLPSRVFGYLCVQHLWPTNLPLSIWIIKLPFRVDLSSHLRSEFRGQGPLNLGGSEKYHRNY